MQTQITLTNKETKEKITFKYLNKGDYKLEENYITIITNKTNGLQITKSYCLEYWTQEVKGDK